jgi:hypothetical protein
MMKKFAVSLILLFLALPMFAQKLTADEVVTKHLDSIGTAEARGAVQNIMTVGDVTFRFLAKADIPVPGRIVLASAGPKNFLGMSFNSNNYPGEQFVYDGKKVKVAMIQNVEKSKLGDFIHTNDLLLEDSLFTGALSSSWVLANMGNSKAKISFDGTKKIDGKEAYMVGYSRKGSGDLTITFYFDKETFHHIRTDYRRTQSAPIGNRPALAGYINEIKYQFVEDFSDFKAEKGLTLPHSYRFRYTETGQNGTVDVEWVCNLITFAFNQQLDDKTFSTN